MPTIDDAINSGDVALNNLYALQTAAMIFETYEAFLEPKTLLGLTAR